MIIVGIPTFRRPQGLEKLLTSLAEILTDGNVQIVVANNDPTDPAVSGLVATLTNNRYPFHISVLNVPERGISQARNALLAHTLATPSASFLAMIDDDEWPDKEWLERLRVVQSIYNADVVGGPVRRFFAPLTPDYVKRANAFKTKSAGSGIIKSIESTANLLFRIEFLRNADEQFDPAFSITGGGDRDFLMRLRKKGATFAWAHDAWVSEDFPASRCTPEWAVKRAYRVGNTEMRAYLKNRPPNFVIKEAVKVPISVAWALRDLLAGAGRKEARFKAKLHLARLWGKATALTGSKYDEYKTTHGS